MAAERQSKTSEDDVGYDRGPDMETLMRECERDTGHPAPRPQWEKKPYGPHVGLPYVQEWYKRMGELGYKGWNL